MGEKDALGDPASLRLRREEPGQDKSQRLQDTPWISRDLRSPGPGRPQVRVGHAAAPAEPWAFPREEEALCSCLTSRAV